MYQIYTRQGCEHCHEALDLMMQGKIPFEQISTGTPEGIKKFREFYAAHREQIERKEGNGAIDLPVVVNQSNGNVYLGREGLEKFLGI